MPSPNDNRPAREQVHLADVQVAASWQDVMSPPPPPASGAVVTTTAAGGSTPNAAAAAVRSAGSSERGASTSTGHPSSAGETSGGADSSSGAHDAHSTAAAERTGAGREATNFEIVAGDGLTEDDAAGLTAILREVRRGATFAQQRERLQSASARNLSLTYPDGVGMKPSRLL